VPLTGVSTVNAATTVVSTFPSCHT
jgi:hypothetical protein